MLIARGEVWNICRSTLEIHQGHPRILSDLGLALGDEEEPDVVAREERGGILEDVHFPQTRGLVHQHRARDRSHWSAGAKPVFLVVITEALSVLVHDHHGDVHDIPDFPFGPHAHLFQRIEVAAYEPLCPCGHYRPRQVTFNPANARIASS